MQLAFLGLIVFKKIGDTLCLYQHEPEKNNVMAIEYTHKSRTVYAKRRLEVGVFMEVMFEALSHGMAIGTNKICLHFSFADHPISGNKTHTNTDI